MKHNYNERITLTWLDRYAKTHTEIFEGRCLDAEKQFKDFCLFARDNPNFLCVGDMNTEFFDSEQ